MLSSRTVGVWIACVTLAVVGCAAKQPKPVETRALLVASADVNPDPNGRPSPIVVRIYQLRGDTEFNNANFFDIYEKEKETLGASLIAREEKTLFPGQQIEIDLPLSGEARFVGAVAAYRDLATSRWRAQIGRPEKSLLKTLVTQRISIGVGKDAIILSAKN
jgi:type VI secretion system protein VasD